MRYSYNEPDLFIIAKIAAPKTYRTYNPSTLEDFISYLEEDIADELADSGFISVDENCIQQQAERTASWWWTNVFQKDRLPQNQKEALKKTAVEELPSKVGNNAIVLMSWWADPDPADEDASEGILWNALFSTYEKFRTYCETIVVPCFKERMEKYR